MVWNTIRKLIGDLAEPTQATNVTQKQVAHQLLQNGKTQKSQTTGRLVRDTANETNILSNALTVKELNHAVNIMKNGTPSGVDGLST